MPPMTPGVCRFAAVALLTACASSWSADPPRATGGRNPQILNVQRASSAELRVRVGLVDTGYATVFSLVQGRAASLWIRPTDTLPSGTPLPAGRHDLTLRLAGESRIGAPRPAGAPPELVSRDACRSQIGRMVPGDRNTAETLDVLCPEGMEPPRATPAASPRSYVVVVMTRGRPDATALRRELSAVDLEGSVEEISQRLGGLVSSRVGGSSPRTWSTAIREL